MRNRQSAARIQGELQGVNNDNAATLRELDALKLPLPSLKLGIFGLSLCKRCIMQVPNPKSVLGYLLMLITHQR